MRSFIFIPVLCTLTTFFFGNQSLINLEEVEPHYSTSNNKLDDIEGVWALNVVKILYENDRMIAAVEEEARSEWAIIRVNQSKFKVQDINRGSAEDNDSTFDAFFEKTSQKNIYNYQCRFTNPDWTAKTTATLLNPNFIVYDYEVSQSQLKKYYKDSYHPGMSLHWYFYWRRSPVE